MNESTGVSETKNKSNEKDMTQDMYDKTMTKKHNMTIKGNTGGLSSCALRSWESLLRYAICLLLLMVVGVNSAWGQSEGVYYIDNNTGHSGATNARYYLIPADDPQKTDKHDAFYSSNYSMQNGDPEKPFLTVYKTNKDAASVPAGVVNNLPNNSVWILKAVSGESGYFYIIHASSGKYVIYEPPHPTKSNRKSMHLLATDSPGENAKFKFTISGSGYIINPKSVTSGNMYFNPAGSAWDKYYGNGGSDNPAYDYIGLIGLYTSGGSSVWYTESTLLVAPTISDVSASNTITITDANSLPAGYTIRYTTGDGTQDAPTATTGTEYSGPIDVISSWTVKAVVVRYGIVLTRVASKAVSPVISAPTVTNNYDGTISLSTTTPNAVMYYTTDGSTPSSSNGTQYLSAFSLGNATVIKAITYNSGLTECSGVTIYNVPQYDSPTISFNSSTLQVTIASSGTAYYTTDGSTPTTSSAAYSAPFTVTTATTVKAIATHAGYLTSGVATLAITQVATPTIQNNGSNAISITSATPGATIYYTTNGDTPTISSTEYTGPLTENVSGVTIKAIAVKENMITSEIGSGSVTLACDVPTIVQTGKTFTISCGFPTSATIRYTLDGTDPVSSSTVSVYSGTIDISSATLPITIKAYASATGYTTSEISTLTISSFGNGTAENPYIIGSNDFSEFIDDVNNDPAKAAACYLIQGDINASGCDEITSAFTGTLEGAAKADGTFPTISGLSHALFNTVNGGTVKNIMLSGVNIPTGGTNVGAVCNEASGSARIYNCGVLSGTIQGSGYVGGIVGDLKGNARVINCYSFAEVKGGAVAAGVVGCISTNVGSATINEESVDIAIDQSHVSAAPMVMNCMFYGDITSGTKRYPVYGGSLIRNDGTGSVNGYNYYRQNTYDRKKKEYIDDVTFDEGFTVNDYNRSWPAEEQHLTRFEYYRSILNSNRRLCTWWVNGINETAPSDEDVANVGIAKWVLDPGIAPYPILKKWGKYPSIINPDEAQTWDPEANSEQGAWQTRSLADPHRGKSHGTFTVSVKTGTYPSTLSGLSEKTEPWTPVITEMDTLNYDYGYYKIQLPYYNDVFGDPDEAEYLKRYYGNYTAKAVTGWKITAVNNNDVGAGYTFNDNWENGCNFADRSDKYKDLYGKSGRVFAQGGYYYVPEGVTSIEIEAYWGDAFYLHSKDHALDRVNVTNKKNYGDAFSPAGTLSVTMPYGNISIYDDFATLMTAVKVNTSCNVYDQAVVLVGNYPLYAHNDFLTAVANNGNGGFTIMSADFDMDNEPDFCMPFQWRSDVLRHPIMPIRFDFLPVPELGLAMRHNQYAYAIGVFVPEGHFEITETSFMHTTQFEYMSQIVNINHQKPLIFNGGQFEQIVCHSDNKWSLDFTKNIIMGGHVWMKRFTPGSHTKRNCYVRHCAVSVMGGDFPEFYLTGLYWTGVTTDNAYNDSPHCYTNGGRFGIMAGAGMEAVKNNVHFEIDHSVIDEFYGGGINSNNPVAGNIEVTINNSLVLDKYCGGPKVGTCGTVTTNAKNTIFNQYFGGGNGGTNLYREQIKDETPNNMPSDSDWDSTYGFSNFTPIKDQGVSVANNASYGYHAEFEFEVFNQSNGLNSDAVARTYRHWAQFGVTKTGSVSNTLENCTLKQNFYGGGNLATVDGNVTSILKGTTRVAGSAFGAGFSATVPSFPVHDKNKVTYPERDGAGVCHNGSVGYLTDGTGDNEKIRYYTWCYKNPTTNVVTPAGVVIPSGVSTSKPAFQYANKWYCYTTVSLENLGTVTGNATLTIDGDSKIGTSGTGHDVYGGGDESAVKKKEGVADSGNTTVILQGNTQVYGNVFGGGNNGLVEGSATVNIRETPTTGGSGSGGGSGD